LPQVDELYIIDGFTDISEKGIRIRELVLYNRITRKASGWVARKFELA